MVESRVEADEADYRIYGLIYPLPIGLFPETLEEKIYSFHKEGLEEGMAIETQGSQKNAHFEEIVAKKNIIIFILAAFSGILALVILLLLMR